MWYNNKVINFVGECKLSNEITVKIKCSIEEMFNILKSKNFKFIEKYLLDDTYFIPNNLKLSNMTIREIISYAIILREVTEYSPENKITKITIKKKEFDSKGNIINQCKIECKIENKEAGLKLLKALGYKELMNIKENGNIYGKDGFQIAIKDIINGEKLIEVETVENDPELDTTEKLKEKINELQIPIDTNDYFVKKAEIELKKIL